MKILSNIFLVITLIALCISVALIKEFGLMPFYSINDATVVFILISIPLQFAGITATLKVINKAMTNQSISFMNMMANSKKK